MGFSSEWDQAFAANTHASVWPWSDLVSYIHRYARPADGYRRVLELGCGIGANAPLFLRLGVDYSAVEGSEAAVKKLRERYPQLAEQVVVGDFTKDIPFAGPFDLVVDRGAITHNSSEDIVRTLGMIFGRLRPGGKLIGIDWFSTDYPDHLLGEPLDSHTRTRFPSGQFVGLGAVHFSDRAHIIDVLTQAGFGLERLEHKRSEVMHPSHETRGWWHFVAVKP